MSNYNKLNLFALVFSFIGMVNLGFAQVSNNTSPKNTIHQSSINQKKIDLNHASAKQIAKSFKGIGPKRSEAIVKYREQHGTFKTLDDLAQVKGISKRFVEKHRINLNNTFNLDG